MKITIYLNLMNGIIGLDQMVSGLLKSQVKISVIIWAVITVQPLNLLPERYQLVWSFSKCILWFYKIKLGTNKTGFGIIIGMGFTGEIKSLNHNEHEHSKLQYFFCCFTELMLFFCVWNELKWFFNRPQMQKKINLSLAGKIIMNQLCFSFKSFLWVCFC